MSTPTTPKPAPPPTQTQTALHVARLAWRTARVNEDTDREAAAMGRLNHLLEKLHATLPKETAR